MSNFVSGTNHHRYLHVRWIHLAKLSLYLERGSVETFTLPLERFKRFELSCTSRCAQPHVCRFDYEIAKSGDSQIEAAGRYCCSLHVPSML